MLLGNTVAEKFKNKMKRLLSLLVLLITISVNAQNPSYDGGSELHNAILKTKGKKPNQKTAPKKSTKKKQKPAGDIYVVERPEETPDEKLFRALNGYSHPDYVRRVTSTKGYAEYTAETRRLDSIQSIKYQAEAPQRRLDSIAEIEKSKKSALDLEKSLRESREFQKKQDSIQKVKKEAVREEQRRKMKENNKPKLFKLF
jgi:hypothetical protein